MKKLASSDQLENLAPSKLSVNDDNVDLILNSIPPELFDTKIIKSTQRSKVQLWGLGILICVACVISVIGIYKYFLSIHSNPTISVYFELKAIDDQGYPIAGADIFHNQKRIGITDSFGEWRKFITLKKGSSFRIEVVKKYEDNILSVSKNYAVPLKENTTKGTEIISTIRLSKTTTNASYNVNQLQKTQNINALTHASFSFDYQKSHFTQQSDNIINTTDDSNADNNNLRTSQDDNIYFEVVTNSSSSSSAAYYEKYLKTNVLPLLIQKARESGLNVNPQSQWRIILSNIVSATNENLIYVRTHPQSTIKTISFLKNYVSDPLVLAQNILDSIKLCSSKNYRVFHHNQNWYVYLPDNIPSFWSLVSGDKLIDINNNIYSTDKPETINELKVYKLVSFDQNTVPCNKNTQKICLVKSLSLPYKAPKDGWKQYELKIIPSLQNMEVFIQGYQAKFINDNKWVYWTNPTLKAKITIIKDNKIIYRDYLENNKTIHLPVANIAKQAF